MPRFTGTAANPRTIQTGRQLIVEMVDLRRNERSKRPDGQRTVSGAPPDRLAGGHAVGHPHFHVLLFRSDALERALVGEVAARRPAPPDCPGHGRKHSRSFRPSRLTSSSPTSASRRSDGCRVSGGHPAPGDFVETETKVAFEISRPDAQPGRHRMPSVPSPEDRCIPAARRRGRSPEMSAARAAPFVSFPADDLIVGR